MNVLDLEYLEKIIKDKKLEDFKDEIISKLNQIVDKYLEETFKKINCKKRIIKNDNAKTHLSAKKILKTNDINKLPLWVKKDIGNAYIIGNSLKVIQTSDGKKYHMDNKLNDLPGAEWTFFLNSVINTRYSTNGEDGFAHHIRKIHPSPKPPQLMKQIIEFFTKENEIVFDYFMGVGGSLLGSSLCNRKAIGIDLNEKYINAYREATKYLGLKEQPTIQGDSIKILKKPLQLMKLLSGEKVSLILIDPPYGDMMARQKTGEALKKRKDTSATPFTDLKEDLGNMDWKVFRRIFYESIIDAMKLLKNKGHVVIFIKDMQPKDKEINLLHADLITDLANIKNLKYLGTKIWADQSVNLYPYGYPFSYVSNQIHQYIMIFRKD